MDGFRLLKSLKLKNFLSFGDPGVELELEPLNVLIGANGSGKSNFVEGVRLIAATPFGLNEAMKTGVAEPLWVWQGGQGPCEIRAASRPSAIVNDPHDQTFSHEVGFYWEFGQAVVAHETLAVDWTEGETEERNAVLVDRDLSETRILVSKTSGPGLHRLTGGPVEVYNSRDLKSGQSVLQQIRDPSRFQELYPSITAYSHIRFHGDWPAGRAAPARRPQLADEPSAQLAPDASNLALVVSELRQDLSAKRGFLAALQRFMPDVQDLDLLTRGGTIQIVVHLASIDRPVPAMRLSDGTLRWLCLLSVVLMPSQGLLICLEEPELGLHPDAIALLAELLVDASQRNQFIITTHSPTLVSALSHVPEAVVVCERDEGGTSMKRMSRDDLGEWLDEYQLGDLWLSGHLGGNP